MTALVERPAMDPSHSIDVEKIRRDFPVLNEKIRDKKLAYFDNGATTQKPLTVIIKNPDKIQPERGIPCLGPGRIARQHIDLARLQGGKPFL